MAWKPKEKPLTLEEAIVLARKELAPYWEGSPPLIAGVRGAGTVTAHPLSEDFHRKSWLLFFVDPTTYSGESACQLAREWWRRYAPHEIGVIVVLRPPHPKLRETDAFPHILQKQGLPIVALDRDELLSAAFRAGNLPKLVLMAKGKAIFERSGADWHAGAELLIHEFLRREDPGLATLPPMETRQLPADTNTPAPRSAGVSLRGGWKREGDVAVVSDPGAVLAFISSAERFGVVAASARGPEIPAVISVEVDGKPLYEGVFGMDIEAADDGRSVAVVRHGRLYHLAARLPEGRHEVTLRFPGALESPVAVFGTREAGFPKQDVR